MHKNAQTRIDETLQYLQGNGMSTLAQSIRQDVSQADLYGISEEISLGKHVLFTDAAMRKRHALRALLLCQRIYLSALWPKYAGVQVSLQPVDCLPVGWKQTSLDHWKGQSEAQIQEGIKAYMATMNRVETLAAVAEAAEPRIIPRHGEEMLKLARSTNLPRQHQSCYGSVMAWLFMCGLVSYRWWLRNNGASDSTSLTDAFGVGVKVWLPNTLPFPATPPNPGLNNVLRGYIVHIYCEDSGEGGWKGHWLVSLGGGQAAGCNNDAEGGNVVPSYSDRCSLNNQFRAYKSVNPNDNQKYLKGIAVSINPQGIPGRT